MKMNYGEEAELICRMLTDRGATLGATHYSQDRDYYRHECEGLTFDKIADNLWQVEDSILYVTYEGKTRWLQFIFGNSFGELVGDYASSPYGEPNLPVDNLIQSVLSTSYSYKGEEHNAGVREFGEAYYDLPFKEVMRIMAGRSIYNKELIE